MLLVTTSSGPLAPTISLVMRMTLRREEIPLEASRTHGLLSIVARLLVPAMKHGVTQFPLKCTFLAKLRLRLKWPPLLMAIMLLRLIPLRVLVTPLLILGLVVETAVAVVTRLPALMLPVVVMSLPMTILAVPLTL